MTYDERLRQFRTLMQDARLSGAFLREGADLEWLTGVPRESHAVEEASDEGILVEGAFIGLRGPVVLLVTHSEWSLYAPLAAALGHDVRFLSSDADPVRCLHDAARDLDITSAIAVSDRLGFTRLELLRAALPDAPMVRAGRLLVPLRARKDAAERAAIARAAEVCDRALVAALPALAPGVRIADAVLELEIQLLRAGSEYLAYRPGIHAAGPQTQVTWLERPKDRRLIAPCSISVDLIAVVDGYRADVGRTVFVGDAPPGATQAVEACREAIDTASSTLCAGVAAARVDDAARSCMQRHGLLDAFVIPTGHGIGLELHEPPRLAASSRDNVTDGTVVAVEVCAWRDGSLSAFWEENMAVDGDQVTRLSHGPAEPLVIA